MLIPGKYEDVSRNPILVGAWLLRQFRQNNSLSLAYAVAADSTLEYNYSATEVTAGIYFLYCCGLIILVGDRVKIGVSMSEMSDHRFESLIQSWSVSSPELVRCLHDLLMALRVA